MTNVSAAAKALGLTPSYSPAKEIAVRSAQKFLRLRKRGGDFVVGSAIMPSPLNSPSEPTKQPRVVERNIEVLVERRQAADRHRNLSARLSDSVTRFAGSMPFVYIHLVVFGLWVVLNLKQVPFPKFDPTFVVLAMFASVEAIFLSAFVLISQNRITALAERQAELDLQISLLTEHEITRLIGIVEVIAKKMDVPLPHDLDEIKRETKPEEVLDRLEHASRTGQNRAT